MQQIIRSLIKLLSLLIVVLGAFYFVGRGSLDAAINRTMLAIEYGPPIDPAQRSGSNTEQARPAPPQPHNTD